MSGPKVAIIGHMIPGAEEIPMPDDLRESRKLLEGQNFTHVVTPEGTFSDHVAYLHSRGLGFDEIRDYRVMINAMTRDQMAKYGGISATTTSRVA